MIWTFLTAVLLLLVYNSDFRNFMLKVSKVSLVLVLFLGMVGAVIYYAEEPKQRKPLELLKFKDENETQSSTKDSKGVLPEGSKLIDPPLPKGFEYRSPFSRSDDAEDSKGDG